MKKEINVGLIGFGTVGSGFVSIFQDKAGFLREKSGVPVRLRVIADRDIASPRSVKVEKGLLTTNVEAVLNDKKIDIIVELIGGIEPAKSYILKAIKQRKAVVTANKALLATHGEEIFSAAEKRGVDIAFEASVGAGIPVIRAIREGLLANHIRTMYGIINGTANYILSRMSQDGGDFKSVLSEAQRKGYAEADPSLDIEGTDSAHKLVILASLAFGTKLKLDDVYREGIEEVTGRDIEYAREFGYCIKLLAIAKEVGGSLEVRVHPTLLRRDHLLAAVNGVFNACYLNGDAVGEIMFYGRGAGQLPTGSAIAADVIDVARNLQCNVSRRLPLPFTGIQTLSVRSIQDVVSRYYFRFSTVDQPGVLANIAGILGKLKISIASVIQKGRQEGDVVPIVMMTHEAKEVNVQRALIEINKLSVVRAKTMVIRIEG